MRHLYRLIKPGIVYSNALVALCAFLFASTGQINVGELVAMLVGLMCTIASGCVINNIMDRDIDTRMERTKGRAIPTGRISTTHAALFAGVLFLIGTGTLYFYTNLLTLLVALFGVFVYLVLYTPLKRYTLHSTSIGALSGAVPPVVGYVAVTGALDATALVLFLILVCWQMTHFLAIAIFRVGDYGAARIPVMSVRAGILHTKIVMVAYAVLFSFAAFSLYAEAHLHRIYAIPMATVSLVWFLLCVWGFYTKNDALWARRMFFYSILVLLVFCAALALS